MGHNNTHELWSVIIYILHLTRVQIYFVLKIHSQPCFILRSYNKFGLFSPYSDGKRIVKG